MDNVQIENGFLVMANEIFEQMAQVKLSPLQYRILFVIWRYTYGFKRKEHNISLSFFVKALGGVDKRNIQRALCELEQLNIIKQKILCGKVRIISFNKHYSQWLQSSSTVVDLTNGNLANGEITNGEIDKGTVVEIDKGTVVDFTHQENKNINKNLNKNIYVSSENSKPKKPKKSPEEIPEEFETFWTYYPRKVEKYSALKCWHTRIKEKYLPSDMIEAAKGYAIACKSNGTEEKYIKHPSTFLGPAKPFLEYVKKETPKPAEQKPVEADPDYLNFLKQNEYEDMIP